MKWIKRYPLLLLLLTSGLLLSAAGFAGKENLYQEYSYDGLTMPLSALVFLGAHDGLYPGSGLAASGRQGSVQTVAAMGEGNVVSESEENKVVADAANALESAAASNTFSAEDADTENAETAQQTEDEEAPEEEDTVYEFTTVTEDYFDDALFIGDSRTVGLYEYAGLEERAEFYCKISLTIWNVLDQPFIQAEDGKEMITLEEALVGKNFGKIYLMVGINELGRGNTEQFIEQYVTVLDELQRLQPDAIIFVEGIMRVAGEKNDTDAIFNNTNINERNDQLRLLADDQNIFYIDVNEAVCDEDGNLTEEYTFDQIHLKAAYYEIWKEFLLEHGIVKDKGED